MYGKILVPLDGSQTAENVLPFARCFARSLQAPVELLAVVGLARFGFWLSAFGFRPHYLGISTTLCAP